MTIHMTQNELNQKLLAAAENNDIDGVKAALSLGADVNTEAYYDETVFIKACRKGCTDIVKLFLEHGADVNYRDYYSWTALMRSTWNRHVNTVKLLLDYGADVNLIDRDGDTALIKAISNYYYSHITRYSDVIGLLLNYNADVNIRNNNGYTALIYGCQNEWVNKETIKKCLKHGASPNIAGNDGWTPLMNLAQWGGRTDIMKTLIKTGAYVGTKNKDGNTAFDILKTYYPGKYKKWIEDTVVKPRCKTLCREDTFSQKTIPDFNI